MKRRLVEDRASRLRLVGAPNPGGRGGKKKQFCLRDPKPKSRERESREKAGEKIYSHITINIQLT